MAPAGCPDAFGPLCMKANIDAEVLMPSRRIRRTLSMVYRGLWPRRVAIRGGDAGVAETNAVRHDERMSEG